MKKSLFFIMALFLAVALFGQTSKSTYLKAPRPERKAVRDVVFTPTEIKSMYVPHSDSKSGLWTIGATYWAAISNTSARNTASTHPSGDMAAVWTYQLTPNAAPRGTGYNWFDKSDNSFGPIPTERIEQLASNEGNPGFPTHGFTENGEIIVAHNPQKASMMVLTREKRGVGEWVQNEIYEPKYPNGIFWPTLCTNGNTVHFVAVYDCTYGNSITNPIYYRSKDGGLNWDIKALEIPQIPQIERDGSFADNYLITCKGDHVVFFWINFDEGNVGYVESLDGGDSWTYKQVFECNESTNGREYYMSSITGTVAIDDNDVVHVAFTAAIYQADGWYPLTAAIIYWKDTMPMLTLDYLGFVVTPTEFILSYLDLSHVLFFPDLLGFNKNEFWFHEGGYSLIQGANNTGGLVSPRIVAEDGKVFLAYGSIIEQPMGIFDAKGLAYYRGVFLTVSDDNGDSFDQRNKTSWISYHKNYFICLWNDYLGPKDPNNAELGINGEIIPDYCSENCWPTMATHSDGDNLLLQWCNTYKAGELSDSYEILTLVLPKSFAGIYNNTQEVHQGKWNDYNIGINEVTGGVQNINIYPNPAQNEAILFVNSTCSKPYTITIANTMGQLIQTQKGQLGYGDNNIKLNINSLSAGVYLLNIRTDNAIRTQKLIVK